MTLAPPPIRTSDSRGYEPPNDPEQPFLPLGPNENSDDSSTEASDQGEGMQSHRLLKEEKTAGGWLLRGRIGFKIPRSFLKKTKRDALPTGTVTNILAA
jgi:hypothetical protein